MKQVFNSFIRFIQTTNEQYHFGIFLQNINWLLKF